MVYIYIYIYIVQRDSWNPYIYNTAIKSLPSIKYSKHLTCNGFRHIDGKFVFKKATSKRWKTLTMD